MDVTPPNTGRTLRTRKPVDYSEKMARYRSMTPALPQRSTRKVQTERKTRPSESIESPSIRTRRNRSIAKQLNFVNNEKPDVVVKSALKVTLRVTKEKENDEPEVVKQAQSRKKSVRIEESSNDGETNEMTGDEDEKNEKEGVVCGGRQISRGRSCQVSELTPIRVVVVNSVEPNHIESSQRRRSARRSTTLTHQLQTKLSTNCDFFCFDRDGI
jgi:hypothetical protein